MLVLRSDSRVTSSTEAAQRSAGEQNCQRGQFCSQSFEGITGTDRAHKMAPFVRLWTPFVGFLVYVHTTVNFFPFLAEFK